MNKKGYLYDRTYASRYTFVSKGKKGAIVKIVEFSPTIQKKIFNLAFGDLVPDGTIDDNANTNNGDIVKVITTVIHILKDFTSAYSGVKIVFAGSTALRTTLYSRILKMYYDDFSKEFKITTLIESENGRQEVIFDPESKLKYLAFFVKRIH
jgi:hypothetical protein